MKIVCALCLDYGCVILFQDKSLYGQNFVVMFSTTSYNNGSTNFHICNWNFVTYLSNVVLEIQMCVLTIETWLNDIPTVQIALQLT